MKRLSSELVQPLRRAGGDFLQVLVSSFTLRRRGGGSHLVVRFNEDTPTIRRREAKSYLPRVMPAFTQKARKYQADLDAFLSWILRREKQ